ncbi:uncharacterized protein AMSG_11656 [Thecamonas trahens ATCC 50062]|uniref:EGF-like domain-containing protein n=1 Tax=Thecamonas trahens ATCC 50062 TaxID=461836 RepID=A0A0L0DQT4_THETB|nr:hypothetical protein AMSG_11656 [Thecamonas trahens ATCC 50062]KNC54654.1 hypothetical protein AMSG_11656 [Thecamonas trahens ATCC 50062]|eukprot:XP_013761766.1 hypothetical protein AMSG_11656 [Thecamonas trahens ATCC 50062]
MLTYPNTTTITVVNASMVTNAGLSPISLAALPDSTVTLSLLTEATGARARASAVVDQRLARRLGSPIAVAPDGWTPLTPGTPALVDISIDCADTTPAAFDPSSPKEVATVFVAVADSTGAADTIVITFEVLCKVPAASCAALNDCSGHGVCEMLPLAPYHGCTCDAGYVGDDCSGRFGLGLVNFPPESPVSCPGVITLDLGLPDDLDPADTGVAIVVDLFTFAFTDIKFLNNERNSIPSKPLDSGALTFEIVHPGTFYIVYASGSSLVGYSLVTVVEWAPPCGPVACSPADPIASCSGRGSCTGSSMLGGPACECSDSFYGAACEHGCAERAVRTGFGGRLTDGTPRHLPLAPSANCTWVFHPNTPGDGIRLVINWMDIDPDVPLIVTSHAPGQTSRSFSGRTLPPSLDLPYAPVELFIEEPSNKVSFGFDLELFTLGCPAGSFIDTVALDYEPDSWVTPRCTPCPPGSFSSTRDSTSCQLCPVGFFAPLAGSISCSACLAGTATSVEGATACDVCPAGHFSGRDGLSSCAVCPPGYFAAQNASSACARCDVTGYAPLSGSKACETCPALTRTPYLGATQVTECLCAPGSYHPQVYAAHQHNVSVTHGIACVPCPNGAVCTGGMVVPHAKPGYWASPKDPLVFLKCIESEACPGGEPGVCGGGRVGTLCSLCPIGYFASLHGTCKQCSAANKAALSIGIVFGCIALLILRYIANMNVNDNLRSTLGLGTSFGIWIQYLQFADLFASFSVNWPSTTQAVLDQMAYANLDWDAFTPSCAVLVPYEISYALRVAVPIFVAGFYAAYHLLHATLHPIMVSLLKPAVIQSHRH